MFENVYKNISAERHTSIINKDFYNSLTKRPKKLENESKLNKPFTKEVKQISNSLTEKSHHCQLSKKCVLKSQWNIIT